MKNKIGLKQSLRQALGYQLLLCTFVGSLIGASSGKAQNTNGESSASLECVSHPYGAIPKDLVGAWKIPQKNVGSTDSSQVFLLISSKGAVKMLLEDKNGFLTEDYENFYNHKVLFFLKKISSQQYTVRWSCDYLKFMKDNQQDLGQINDTQKSIVTIKKGKLYVKTLKEDQYYDRVSVEVVNQVIEQNKKIKAEKIIYVFDLI